MELRPMRFLVERLRDSRKPFGPVGLDNVIHVDVAPASAGFIHELDLDGLSGEWPDIPACRDQTIAVPACGTANDFPSHQKVDARMTFVAAAANEERDVGTL